MASRKMMYISWILLWSISLLSCVKGTDEGQGMRVKGISYESPSAAVNGEIFTSMQAVNANYVGLIPFGFVRKGAPEVQYDLTWQWWGERSVGITSLTRDAHARGLQVMVKPQVWIGGGGFTGTYDPGSEAAWVELENSYFNYIIHFAKLAQREKVELYCIGTEWKVFMQKRPAFWERLIDSVRVQYSGKLTYAGNWDAYAGFPHWHKLDYIGIDAYFPISEAQTPTVAQIMAGWQSTKAEIKKVQRRYNKPVLFTEYGYRSMDYCAKAPWESGRQASRNQQAQLNAYEGFYKSMWQESWFAGGFLWKWHSPHEKAGGANNNRFTPQNKSAEAIVKKWYGKP